MTKSSILPGTKVRFVVDAGSEDREEKLGTAAVMVAGLFTSVAGLLCEAHQGERWMGLAAEEHSEGE